MRKTIMSIAILPVALVLSGCATESSRIVKTTKVESHNTPYKGVKSLIAIGKFENRSNYMNGIFSDGVDRLGNQSKTILISHLQQTGRFNVLDRTNMGELQQEARIKGKNQKIKGATYIITGDVTEFGRKSVGDTQLWGILGRGKEQIAYAKTTLNVVNVGTTEVVYSVQGTGEYALSSREVVGFGSTASYDSTLNGKVLDLAIKEAVNNLVRGIENKEWEPEN